MKILLVANKDITLYLFRKEFIEELIKKYEVHILCPQGDKLSYFESLGVKLHYYELDRRGKNPLNELKVLLTLKKKIKNIKPDYIFSYTIKPNIYVGLISCFMKCKFVPTITGLGTVNQNKGLLSKIIKKLYKISFKKSYIAVFQNSNNLNWFKTNVNNKVNTLLVNGSGVNLTKFSFVTLEDTPVTSFLFLGRIMKEKGIEEYIEAATTIKNRYGNKVIFSVAGFMEDDYKDQLEASQNNNIIQYLGFIEDTQNILINHTALVLPSYHEGLSNVILEAQATGRPVLASRIPGCIEAFEDNLTGISFTVKDTMDLINKLDYFIGLSFNDKKNMSFNARKFVEDKYSRAGVVQKYLDVIEKENLL
jgi:galacturonosyltransferase